MRTLNPAMKFVTLLCVTFVLAFRYNPVLNLAVFVLCMAALLVSKVRLKTLGLLMLPILLAATGMFFTGYRFSADASMPVAAVSPLGILDIISGSTTAISGISLVSTQTNLRFFSTSVMT